MCGLWWWPWYPLAVTHEKQELVCIDPLSQGFQIFSAQDPQNNSARDCGVWRRHITLCITHTHSAISRQHSLSILGMITSADILYIHLSHTMTHVFYNTQNNPSHSGLHSSRGRLWSRRPWSVINWTPLHSNKQKNEWNIMLLVA